MKIDFYNLEDLCLKIVDCPHSTPNWLKSGIPVIRNFNLRKGRFDFSDAYFVSEEDYRERTKRAIPKYRDIIFSREAPIGDVSMVPENFKCCLGQRLVLLRPNEEICSSEYLLYALQTNYVKKQIKAVDKTGSIVSNYNISDLKKLQIPVVNNGNSEQIRVLKYIDELLKNNEDRIELLEKMIEQIYNQWFIQFNFPNENNKPYKECGGELVYNNEIGYDIPVNWKVKDILDCIKWIGGSQPPKSQHIYNYEDGYIRFIQNRDYANNDNLTFIPISKSNKVCNEYDIMIDKYGDAGKTRFGIEGAYNVALSKIETMSNQQEYIRNFLKLPYIYGYLNNSCKASTRASLNEETFKRIKLVLPEKCILEKFEVIGKNIIKEELELKKQNEKLNHLREYMMTYIFENKKEG